MVKIESESLIKTRDTNKHGKKPRQDKQETKLSSPHKSASRCNKIRSALKTKPLMEPPRKYKGKKDGRERIRKSTKDVTSLKCIRF